MSDKNIMKIHSNGKTDTIDYILKYNDYNNMENVVNIISNHLEKSEDLDKILNNTLDNLANQKEKITEYNQKNWFYKLRYKQAKW